jgi:membrane protein implicated in regulation of membrane protease activity
MANDIEIVDVEFEEEPKAEVTATSGIKPWLIIVIAVVILGLIGAAVYFLMQADAGTTTKIRDIFIIFMALEFAVLGVALVILIIQLAKLVNMLENEVKPIIASTAETINTLKGTTEFLSENLVAPVIKLNGYMAGFKKVFDLLKIIRR